MPKYKAPGRLFDLLHFWFVVFFFFCFFFFFLATSCSLWDLSSLRCLQPDSLQHGRLSCPPLSPRVCSDSCLLIRWCYLTISSSGTPFSFCLQSFPASGFFPVSQLFVSGGQSIGASASASVLAMNIQGWFLLELMSLISLLSKGLSRVFSSTTIWKHQFFSSFL